MGMMFRFRMLLYLIWIINIVSGAWAIDLPRVLVVSPDAPIFTLAKQGIAAELEGSFRIESMRIDANSKSVQIKNKIKELSPRALVLMDNLSIRLYKGYLDQAGSTVQVLPAIALMAIDVEGAINGIPNIQGISYETPMVTALVNLRNVLRIPIEKVGVIYRKQFEPTIIKQIDFCKMEKIDIIGVVMPDDKENLGTKISEELQSLLNVKKIDALWIPNDNVLLTLDLLKRSWIPVISKSKTPVVVGIETLVDPAFNFGTFAVLPDPKGAGEQAANLLSDLSENNWTFSKIRVYQPVSVYSVINLDRVRHLKNINLEDVQKVLPSGKGK